MAGELFIERLGAAINNALCHALNDMADDRPHSIKGALWVVCGAKIGQAKRFASMSPIACAPLSLPISPTHLLHALGAITAPKGCVLNIKLFAGSGVEPVPKRHTVRECRYAPKRHTCSGAACKLTGSADTQFGE
jgi:hypothetical protein